MASFGWLINPIISNWVTILITSIVTLVAAFISNYGIKKKFKSAKDKERQRALEALRTAIESLIINNREKITEGNKELEYLGLSAERIEDLIEAAEREHQVSLSQSTTPVSLL
jgi:Kef-type K+ transport system membrane component KefB